MNKQQAARVLEVRKAIALIETQRNALLAAARTFSGALDDLDEQLMKALYPKGTGVKQK